MKKELAKIADVLLEAGTMLMESGANTGRIRVTVNRMNVVGIHFTVFFRT